MEDLAQRKLKNTSSFSSSTARRSECLCGCVECGLFAEIGSERNARQLLDGSVSVESLMPERNQQDDDKTTNSELESLAAIFRHQTDTSGKKRQKTDSRQTARQRGNSLSRAHHLASSSSGSRHRCAGHELPSQPVAVPDIHWLSR
jgi:hypothetical protein